MTVIVVTVAVLAAATLAGWLLTRRSGRYICVALAKGCGDFCRDFYLFVLRRG